MPPAPPTDPPVWGVLLAAGLGMRMGPGPPKPLVPLGGEALVRHAARALAGAGCDGLLAVVPPGGVGETVAAALADLPFACVPNPDPARGMAGSFRVAAGALPAGAAALFALGDMPFVTADAHATLLGAFRETGAPAVLAEYAVPGERPVRAPPHLLRADLLEELRALPDADHGPRSLLRAHGAEAVTLTFPADLLLDVDTPAALETAEARLASRPAQERPQPTAGS